MPDDCLKEFLRLRSCLSELAFLYTILYIFASIFFEGEEKFQEIRHDGV